MKKYIAIMLAAVLAAVSCNLDQAPYSETVAADYVKGDASVNNLLIGAYNGLYDVMYYEWAMTELRSDNVRMRVNQSSSGDTKLVEQLDQNVVQTANDWVENYWNACYKVIYRANSVLANIDKVKNGTKRAQYEGEALFLRAWMHFNLVRLWGPCFKVTRSIPADEARHMQRSTVDEVYDLIEEDLGRIISEKLLPAKMSDDELGRADIIAAEAMLAKVYMTRWQPGDEGYAEAIPLLEAVMDSCSTGGIPTLIPYADVFDKAKECNSEILLAVRYKSGSLGIGSPFTTLFAPINNAGNVAMGSPKHFNFPSDNLIAAYAQGDLRKDVTLQESYYNATTGQIIDGASGRYCSKFIDKDMSSEWDAENDWPVIRLADVLLLYSEAYNEINGPGTKALECLNAVRTRAGLDPYDAAELGSRFAFRTAVRNERRLELAMENHRWFDLLRWENAVATVNAFYTSEIFYSGYNYTVNPIEKWQTLLPVPTAVLNINKDIAQNPGY